MSRRPVVHLLATGGTIAGMALSPESLTEYTSGVVPAARLLQGLPALAHIADVRVEDIASVDSCNMSVAIWLTLARRINALAKRDDVNGFVITHGTDTLEETAYFLNLTIKSTKPVVLVGAMRPASGISADGPLNLLNAVAVAASPEACGKGVLVVLDGQINAAREVTKNNTLSPETFKSNELGLLGYVVDYKPLFYRMSNRAHTLVAPFSVEGLDSLPRVDIFYNDVGIAPDMLCAAVDAGAEGLINAGTGNGSVPESLVDVLRDAVRRGVAVVRSSRVGSGVVTKRPSDAAWGFIRGDNLTPQKARVLLMLALTKSRDAQEIQTFFDIC